MKKIRFTAFIILMAVGFSAAAQTQESKIQALFILKFIENISWPQDRKDVVIGVVGKNDIIAELESRLQAKNPNGMVVKKITPAEIGTCDVVYVPSTEDKYMSSVLGATSASKSVLLITETDYSSKGSGISFIEEAGKIRFAINKNAIESKGLKISGALLSLGKQV
jgi:hypothetical protein